MSLPRFLRRIFDPSFRRRSDGARKAALTRKMRRTVKRTVEGVEFVATIDQFGRSVTTTKLDDARTTFGPQGFDR